MRHDSASTRATSNVEDRATLVGGVRPDHVPDKGREAIRVGTKENSVFIARRKRRVRVQPSVEGGHSHVATPKIAVGDHQTGRDQRLHDPGRQKGGIKRPAPSEDVGKRTRVPVGHPGVNAFVRRR